jgi:hypothetical protein
MRTRVLLLGIAALVICSLLLFFRPREEKEQLGPPETQTSVSNQPVRAKRSESTRAQENQNAAASTTVLSGTTAPFPVPYNPNAIGPNLLTNWQAPIEFYGKVVDENSNAVAGANVQFQWMELPTDDGSRKSVTQSDAEGLFSLQGAHGPSLSVSVSKEGYYPRRGGAQNGPLAAASFSPDPQNPVIFQLRKKGMGEALVAVNRSYRIPRDATAISIDLATGAFRTAQNGNLVVQCRTNDKGKKPGERYDWHCIVAVPGGGLLATDEEFPLLAPDREYKSSLEINMPADGTNWNSQVDLKFYYRLADGRYGRMTFSMIAGGQHFCMIDSLLNPSGSRNLEPTY